MKWIRWKTIWLAREKLVQNQIMWYLECLDNDSERMKDIRVLRVPQASFSNEE